MLLTRNTFIVSIAVCACALVLWFVMSNKLVLPASNNQPVSQVPATEKSVNVQPVENTITAPATPKIIYKEDYGVFGANPSDISEVDQWHISMGYSDSSLPKDEYSSYDDATLQKLVDSGDMRAMLALAIRYRDAAHVQEFGLNAAIPLYHKAAVYGSTHAIQRLSTAAIIQIDATRPAEERRIAKLEAVALSKVAATRGDMAPLWSTLRLVEGSVQFTQADFEFIDKRGQEIYYAMQQQREELGLGPFDNSVPDAVRRFFISTAEYHEKQKSIQYQYAQYEKSKQK